ncbi:Importin-13 B like [Actinidia chinensis var. chinensis]|uniref:Importin-13 B like n=1 Tax=Actinidia chinensis var. chinensis TaxID=1590841 RepID=A0A2R6P7S7_ACTCC|nr:Importin-13 B like [Actinidia chinensis var. chinensis]
MATEAKPITLKLLIDTVSRNVLFAEAGKDFVDFLFGFLQLPLASILSLFGNHSMSAPGSLTKIYNSVQDLSNDYFQTNQTKDPILRPKSASSNTKHTLLLNQLAEGYVGSSSKNEVEGYVKGVVTYMVMDDLTVKPMSTISGFTLLNTLKIKDLGSLEEKNVEIDMDKGLKLLKASFESTTVLTDVFLPPVVLFSD